MTPLRRAGAVALTAVRARIGILLLAAAVGALGGAAWGLSAQPEYAAVATVTVVDRGAEAEALGEGRVGGSGPEARGRLLEFAHSPEVAVAAAGALGADVSGADLLARTELRVRRGGTMVIRSTATTADFAAAAANAFATAITETAARSERRRLERAGEELAAELSGLDPASDEAVGLQEQLDSTRTLRAAGAPLAPGREAEIPSTPENERPVAASAAIGAALAFTLALLVLAAIEIIRRPVRRLSDVEAAIGAPGLATLALLPAPGRSSPTAADAGVVAPTGPERDGYIELADALGLLTAAGAAGSAAVRAIEPRGGSADAGRAPGAVAVVSPMPAEGRTSVALGIAAIAAAAGSQVMLVEADMRRPVLAGRLGLPQTPGLADYLTGDASPREVMGRVPLVAGDPAPASFVCVTAGSHSPSPAELLRSSRFGDLVERLGGVYDLVVFDTPPLLLSSDAATVATHADAAVLCARDGRSTPAELRRAEEALEHAQLAGAVLTSVRRGGPGSRVLSALPRG